jgi:hypothetical protein
MDAGRLSLTLCEDTVEEEEQNIITGTLHLKGQWREMFFWPIQSLLI